MSDPTQDSHPRPSPEGPPRKPAAKRRNFFSVAADLGLIEERLAERLNAEAVAQGVAPAELVRGKGLLSPTQLEIVDSLSRPFEIVPGYKLQSLIGHGGMGVVYRARQLSLNRDVALKTVLAHKLQEAGAEGLARFEREAQLIARLAHPHIVTAYDFGRSDGRLFLAMELVAGEDLEQLCQRAGPLAEALAWQIIRQTAAGLAHAGEQNIVHRDIKPSNLLATTPPAGFPLPAGAPLIKIADFGLAWLAASSEAARLTSGRLVVGTPQFMAPEQLQGNRISQQADIYALGATAWRLLAGEQPLSGMPVSQIVACKLSGRFPPLAAARAGLAPETLALVGEMTEHDPEQRPRNYADLLVRIDRLLRELSAGGEAGDSLLFGAGFSPKIAAAEGNLAATLQIHQAATQVSPAPALRSRALSWLTRGLFVAAVLAALFAVGLWFTRAPQLGAPDLAPTVHLADDLFNGRDTNNWAPIGGQWSDARNLSGAAVLQGVDGVAARSLKAYTTQSRVWRNYQLNLVVELRDAERAEIWFDLPATTGEHDDRFWALVIDSKAARVVQRWRSRPGQELQLEQREFAGDNPRRQVELAGHTHGWFIQVDGQRLGAVRRLRAEPAAEFRLAAVAGSAWFSDFVLTELGPKQPH